MSRIGLVLGVVGVVLLAVLLALQLWTLVQGANMPGAAAEQKGIAVVAEGKASGKPDLAIITLGVQTRDPEAQKAAEENDAQMAKVMAALRAMGIADEDVQTSDYSIQAEIDWNDGEQRVLGYVVNNAVVVKIRDIDKVGDVLDAATEAGANNVYGIQFTFDDPTALREQARAAAMAEARKKADALATLAGVRLGRPRYISESFTEIPPLYAAREYALAPAQGGGVTPVSAGQLEVTVQVQVTYDIG